MNVIKSIVELSHAEYLRKTEHEAYIIHTIQKNKNHRNEQKNRGR